MLSHRVIQNESQLGRKDNLFPCNMNCSMLAALTLVLPALTLAVLPLVLLLDDVDEEDVPDFFLSGNNAGPSLLLDDVDEEDVLDELASSLLDDVDKEDDVLDEFSLFSSPLLSVLLFFFALSCLALGLLDFFVAVSVVAILLPNPNFDTSRSPPCVKFPPPGN
jgi:hypothetical protein